MENKVNKEQMSELPYIIAVDFDGTLVEDEFPRIGRIRQHVWDKMKEARNQGAKIILWTSRDHENLTQAVKFCRDRGWEFDAINENLQECQELFNNDTRKVYANEYWDDKAIGQFCTSLFTGGEDYGRNKSTNSSSDLSELSAAMYG